MNISSGLSAVSEYLSVALEGVRQVEFEWHVEDDKLHFSGQLTDGLGSVLLDMSRACRPSDLPALIHHCDRDEFRAWSLRATGASADRDGVVHTVEVRLKDTACEWRWVEIAGKVSERNLDGRVLRMVGTLSDIHARKQAELRLARLRGLYAASSQINQAIVRMDNCKELFSEICRVVVEHGGFHCAWIELSDAKTGHISPAAAYGIDPHAPRKPSMTDGAGIDGNCSAASFPLRRCGRFFGSLNLCVEEKDFFDQSSVDVLEEMTRDISFAIDRYEREAQRRRAEAIQLGQNRILDMVATGVPLADILLEIARLVETHTNRGLCSIWVLDAEGARLSDSFTPSLPKAYPARLAELAVGPCHAARHPDEPIMCVDIASDQRWGAGYELALEHGIQACASWPIAGKGGKVLGTFALHFRNAGAPAPQDLELINIAAYLAGVAIESRASEERIRYLAHYDGLTALPNRFLFNEYLDLALRSAQRHAKKFAVLFLDLDKFKDINDSFGHEAGDQVLREIAARLRNTLRHTDKIARMGGDEFYVLIEELTDGCYASEVARKLTEEASRPISIGDRECQLSVSIGIAIYPDDGDNGQALLKNADSAMYRVKERGKNGYQFFANGANVPAGKATARQAAAGLVGM